MRPPRIAQAPIRRSTRIVGSLLIIVFLLGFAESASYSLPRMGGQRGIAGILYFPPEISEARYARILTIRDPILGWGWPPSRPRDHLDSTGARFSPAYPVPGNECVSLYGDSFTYAVSVRDENAWGNTLAERVRCRVGNFGVGGYGTDQALLRFMHNSNDPSPIAVLGIYADNIQRNVNRVRYFLVGGDPLLIKPRFVLDDDGALKLVALPSLSYSELMAGFRSPAAVWKDEWFSPGSEDGPVVWSFPYSLSLVRSLDSHRLRSLLLSRSTWLDFYKPDHPSRALSVTLAIVAEFQHIAIDRGKAVLVVLFPAPEGYLIFRETGISPFKPLTQALLQRGIAVIDLSSNISTYLGERNFCTLLTVPAECQGHLNVEGNDLTANAVEDYIHHIKVLSR